MMSVTTKGKLKYLNCHNQIYSLFIFCEHYDVQFIYYLFFFMYYFLTYTRKGKKKTKHMVIGFEQNLQTCSRRVHSTENKSTCLCFSHLSHSSPNLIKLLWRYNLGSKTIIPTVFNPGCVLWWLKCYHQNFYCNFSI